MMAHTKKTTKPAQKKQLTLIKRYKKALYLVVPILVFGIYLNVANNHFYHHLHSAGLLWPQNHANYTVGNGMGKKLSYVALGDSLTSGVGAPNFESSYSYNVAQRIVKPNQQIELTPLSTPGFKAKDIITTHLDTAVAMQPNLVTVLIGVNDVHGMSPSAKEFQKNYETIVRRLKTETKADIYVIGIPYIGADNLIWQPYSSYYGVRTKMFNKIIRDLADKYGVHYINLYNASLPYAHKKSNYYSKDDFHPSATGYDIWAEVIARDINH